MAAAGNGRSMRLGGGERPLGADVHGQCQHIGFRRQGRMGNGANDDTAVTHQLGADRVGKVAQAMRANRRRLGHRVLCTALGPGRRSVKAG